MASGVLTISAWKKWVEPSTGINGAFIAMMTNGLAVVHAHYLVKQPDSARWVSPDDTFEQIQQKKSRKGAERKRRLKMVSYI